MHPEFFDSSTRILSVGEFTLAIQACLAAAFPSIWVSGEVSGRKQHQNGHFYFTLKDAEATLPCVIWRKVLRTVETVPAEGDHIEALGRLDLYPPHGRYQFNVIAARPKGRGELYIALERLKKALRKEGLFSEERKRPIPLFPRRIGIVTSPTSAAIRDLITIILSRDPKAQILVSPAIVQGRGAAVSIQNALLRLRGMPGVDVVIVGRGGGALEDLWAFNEEIVVRAIFSSPVPVVSAVGHETDVTLSDLVADVRASTPSHAGELVAPTREIYLHEIFELHSRIFRSTKRRLSESRRSLALLEESLPTPQNAFERTRFRIETFRAELVRLLRQRIEVARQRLYTLVHHLEREHPRAKLASQKATLLELQNRLENAWRTRLTQEKERIEAKNRVLWLYSHRLILAKRTYDNRIWERFGRLADKLHTLSPLQTLKRGYSRAEINKISLQHASTLTPGTKFHLLFSQGSLLCRIEEVFLEKP